MDNIRIEFLRTIFETQSTSGNSSNMERTIMHLLDTMHIDYYMDMYGNIYGYSHKYFEYDDGFFPLLTAHLDTVHDIKHNYKVVYDNDTVYAMAGNKQTGVGGDDKSGLLLILSALYNNDHAFKFVLFRDEEIGFLGSSEFDLDFAEDVSFIIGIDRKGNSDIMIGSYPQTVGDDVLEHLIEVDEYEVVDDDTFTDSVNIGEVCGISAINISCGYYNPHTDFEYISIKDTRSAYKQLYIILDALPTDKVFECDYDNYRNYGGYQKYDELGYTDVYASRTDERYVYDKIDDEDEDKDEYLYYDGYTEVSTAFRNKISVFDGTYGTDFSSLLSYCTYVEEFIDMIEYTKQSDLEFKFINTLKQYMKWN